jgi:hypothetical protein
MDLWNRLIATFREGYLFWAKQTNYKLCDIPPSFTSDGDYLQFHVDYLMDEKRTVSIIGQIKVSFLGGLGQIGDESEDEYILSIYENTSDLLAKITAELYKN